MKPLIWLVFAIAASLWTLSAWGMASLIEWSLPMLATGDPSQVEAAIRNLSMPAWLAPWIDATWWQPAQSLALWCVQALQSMGPVLATGISWLIPLVWVGWGVVLLVMLVMAGGMHALLSSKGRQAMLPIAAQLIRRRMRG
jgi:hypothetical protein